MRSKEATIKRRSAFLAGLLVLLMLLTGTWAWQSFNQQAFTPTYGNSNFGGRLHDDYDGEGIGAHNKNIYAENFGEHDLFVRVQLREYLALGDAPVGSNSEVININDPSTWPVYLSEETDATTRKAGTDTALIGKTGIDWKFGGEKIFMPTFNQVTHEANGWDDTRAWNGDVRDLFDPETAYKMTSTTGKAVDAFAGRFNVDDMKSASDFLSSGKQTGHGDGSRNAWNPGDKLSGQVLKVDATTGLIYLAPATHEAKSTLTADYGGVMTMKQWQDAETKPTGNFWVLDEDGWFYWANPLPGGEATSLLIQEIMIKEQRQDWQYVMTAVADFATVADVAKMPDLSDDAKDLWNVEGDGITPAPTPTPLPEPLVIPDTPGETFKDPDTGTVWRVLMPDDGNGNALIITEYVHIVNTRYHSGQGFTYYQDTEARTNVNTWFNNPNNVGTAIREQGISYEFQNNAGETVARTVLGAGIEINRPVNSTNPGNNVAVTANELRGRTRALDGSAEPFILSTSEANEYFADSADRQTQVVGTSTNAYWWLRSPGPSSVVNGDRHAIVEDDGKVNRGDATLAAPPGGVRPALWIRR